MPRKRRWSKALGNTAWAIGRAGAMVVENQGNIVRRDQYALSGEDVRTLQLPHDLTAAWLYAVAKDQLDQTRQAYRGWQGILNLNYQNWHAARDVRLGYWDAYHYKKRDQIPDGLAATGWQLPAGEAWLLNEDPKLLGRLLGRVSGVDLGTVPGQKGDPNLPRLSFLFPWFLEYDRGGKKAWEVADQIMAYTYLARAGTVSKLLPDVGQMIPVFFVFRSRAKLGTVRSLLKKRVKTLNQRDQVLQNAAIYMTTEMLFSEYLKDGQIMVHAWEDRPAITMMEVLFAHSKGTLENANLTSTHVLSLDARAAKESSLTSTRALPKKRTEEEI
jgi:hypothetical protein